MSWLDRWIPGRRKKLKQAWEKAEQEYREVCGRIAEIEEDMQRCIEAGKKHDPQSKQYREAERKYNLDDNLSKLLRKRRNLLEKKLGIPDKKPFPCPVLPMSPEDEEQLNRLLQESVDEGQLSQFFENDFDPNQSAFAARVSRAIREELQVGYEPACQDGSECTGIGAPGGTEFNAGE